MSMIWLRVGIVMIILIGSLIAVQAQDDGDSTTVERLSLAQVPALDLRLLAGRINGTFVESIEKPAPEWEIGDLRAIKVDSQTRGVRTIVAQVIAVGDHIVVFGESDARIDAEQARSLAELFDRDIYDQVRELWGSEPLPGIDGDPRVYLVLGRDITPEFAGYISPNDLLPKEFDPFSNEAEVMAINLDIVRQRNLSAPLLGSLLAHEFQHLIREHVSPWKGTWLNEGISTFTEVYFSYAFGHQALYAYLGNPETSLVHWEHALANYGAAGLFLLYLYERFGIELVQTLAGSEYRSVEAVEAALAEGGQPEFDDVFADWTVANLVMDTSTANGQFGYTGAWAEYGNLRVRTKWTAFPVNADFSIQTYTARYAELPKVTKDTVVDIDLTAPAEIPLTSAAFEHGSRAWYSNRVNTGMATLTREFDLTEVDQALLNYSTWFDISEYVDQGYIMVSLDGGERWRTLRTSAMQPVPYGGTALAPNYSGESDGWNRESINLDAYAGQRIRVRFLMVTQNQVSRPSMLIDDMELIAGDQTLYTSDFNSDDGGWEAEGWFLSDNLVPVNVWVRVVQITDHGSVIVDHFEASQSDEIQQVTLVANADSYLVLSSTAPLSSELLPISIVLHAEGESDQEPWSPDWN